MIDLATTTKRTLRPDEVAEVLGKSKRSVYNYIRDGKLIVEKGVEGWRITTESVRDLASSKTPPGLLVVVQEVHGNPA